MRSFLFKIFVLKSLKNYRLFYRVLPILSRTAGLSTHIFCSLRIYCLREVMNHGSMDHITDQSDAAVSMIFTAQKETGQIRRSLFCVLCTLPVNLLRCSPPLLLLWLPLPSPVHRKVSAHSGQIHRSNHLCLRSWNADPCSSRTIRSWEYPLR